MSDSDQIETEEGCTVMSKEAKWTRKYFMKNFCICLYYVHEYIYMGPADMYPCVILFEFISHEVTSPQTTLLRNGLSKPAAAQRIKRYWSPET